MIRYRVKLTKEEVDELQSIIKKGKHTSQTFRTGYILLNCDEGEYSSKVTNEEISKVLKVGMRTIDRVKKKLIEEGFESVLERRPTSRVYDKKADGSYCFGTDTLTLITFRCISAPVWTVWSISAPVGGPTLIAFRCISAPVWGQYGAF